MPSAQSSPSYYRARYYDPQAGRFISEDSIGFHAGINFYRYVDNDPVDLIDPTGSVPCLNINDFVSALNHNASPNLHSTGWCGRYIWLALKAGGLGQVGSHAGKDYGPPLLNNGFSSVSQTGYQPQPGDIAVIQPYPGGNPAGHAEAWNGNQWVSDFKQPYPPSWPGGIYPDRYYRNFKASYAIYRPTPCPTSPTSPPSEPSLIQGIMNWIGQTFGRVVE